jgi:hypothetical protein
MVEHGSGMQDRIQINDIVCLINHRFLHKRSAFSRPATQAGSCCPPRLEAA